MNPEIVQFLLDLNQRFYTDYGASFAATRRRIQPGVRRTLAGLPDSPLDAWIDLGCGSGALAVEWLRAGRQSNYLGVDFSSVLIDEAKQATDGLPNKERVSFLTANLADENWPLQLDTAAVLQRAKPPFAGALCFAVLHHLPSHEMRARLLKEVANLLPIRGVFIHSVWQFQHSPKLMARRADWQQVGLDPADLEPGDTLLDWRAEGAQASGSPGLRYVHLFTLEELAALAKSTGFEIVETFASDGQGGRLGLYQVWKKIGS